MEELKRIVKYISKIRGIVVDDFRCFGTEIGFPSKTALVAVAESEYASKGFEIFVHLDQLIIIRKST